MQPSPLDSLPPLVRHSAIALVIAISAWSWWDYAPPFSWMADAQIAVMGAYHPALAFMMSLIVMLIPLLVVAVVWSGIRGAAPVSAPSRLTPFLMQNRAVLVLTTIGVVCSFVGARDLVDAIRVGDHRCSIALESLTGGAMPETRWVELSGYHVDPERTMTLTEGSTERLFVPLYVRAPSEAPVVIVEARSDELATLQAATPLSGVLRADALPGDIRALFAAAGVASGSYWVLDLGDSPEARRSAGTVLLPIGLVALLAGIALGIRRWRAMWG